MRIIAAPEELTEGLFGQIVLHVFEVLPELRRRNVFPDWAIRSQLYSVNGTDIVIPGVFDLAYGVTQNDAGRDIPLVELRERSVCVLGSDWRALHRLWSDYFVVPARVSASADAYGDLSTALGLHYRGTDKTDSWHTNPVAKEDMILLAKDVLDSRPELDCLMVCSDEADFLDRVRGEFPGMRVVSTITSDRSNFHKSLDVDPERADRALLDCLLLSRCRLVLKGCSALSGFAKILNPELEIYRVAACKMFSDVPYFPVAYIPPLQPAGSAARQVLERQMRGDWLQNSEARRRFGTTFVSRPRHSLVNRAVWRLRRLFAPTI